jgi:hypothetical protein
MGAMSSREVEMVGEHHQKKPRVCHLPRVSATVPGESWTRNTAVKAVLLLNGSIPDMYVAALIYHRIKFERGKSTPVNWSGLNRLASARMNLDPNPAAASMTNRSPCIGAIHTVNGRRCSENRIKEDVNLREQDFIKSTLLANKNKLIHERVLYNNYVFAVGVPCSAICDFLRREDELMTELTNHKQSTS